MKNRLRTSFTVMNLWARGNWREAIKQYFKLDYFETPAMKEGKEYHKKWSEYIKKNKEFPEDLGGNKLIKPQTELKLEVDLEDWLQLVGVIDCVDNKIIYEFKTGITESDDSGYINQVGVYSVLAKKNNIDVEKCKIIHFNQYTKKIDTSVYWISKALYNNAKNWIETLSADMHDYFVKNNLYKEFANRERVSP